MGVARRKDTRVCDSEYTRNLALEKRAWLGGSEYRLSVVRSKYVETGDELTGGVGKKYVLSLSCTSSCVYKLLTCIRKRAIESARERREGIVRCKYIGGYSLSLSDHTPVPINGCGSIRQSGSAGGF